MHGFVLEDGEGGFRALEKRMAGPIEVGMLEGIQHLTVGFGRKVAGRDRERATLLAHHARGRSSARRTHADRYRERTAFQGVASMPGRPSPRFTSVLKLKAGRWPS